MFFHKLAKIVQFIQRKIYGVKMTLQGWRSYCEHGVPMDWAFEHYAAVFQGGVCPTCGKLNQGKFLGNVTGMFSTGMFSIVDGKTVPCEGKPFDYFRERGWKIGFTA